MKILWITHRRTTDMSAASRIGISSALERRGWVIDFMSPDGDFPVERSRRMGFGHRSFSNSVRTVLDSINLDDYSVLIIEWTAVQGCQKKLKSRDVPWIILDRSPPVSTGLAQLIQRFQYHRAWRFARKYAFGRAVKSPLMETRFEWSSLSAIVPSGVDIERFQISEMNDVPLVVCHGSLDRTRELHRLAKMDVNLLLFGEGDDSERLSEITRVEGVGDVSKRLAEADIGVLHLPDRDVWKYASPLKVAEFAASGLPVVASDVSGLDCFRDAPWLKLVPLGDDSACEEALQKFCRLSQKERKEIGVFARNDAENLMNWEYCTEQLHQMLIEVKR